MGKGAAQRAAIVRTLARICGNLETLQGDAESRRACRDVATGLRAWSTREDARARKEESG